MCNTANAQKIEVLQQGRSISIRGLSVVNDKIAWISGSKGTIATTRDGGKTWNWQQVKGFETADFRAIEAFSDKEAVILSSGTPALVLKTMDGGANWSLKYRNDDKAYFLDAMGFADKKRGYILGDPIGGKFLVLETKDGGETWSPFSNMPEALEGEAAFAASGTCLRVESKSYLSIVTGGKVARNLSYNAKAQKWLATDLPVTHGPSSNGAFSISADNKVIVGGNYSKDKTKDSVACYFKAGEFVAIKDGPSGYQSGVEQIKGETYLSTGTPGSNITTDGGLTWKQIDANSYNVCRKAKKGKLVLLAGDRGRIGLFTF
ncbi:WD40/YVTN/BNR-like repeat-containing protein [Mucilaginibacter myungsuensis]|uniref:Oxidoreductase n=1 Tax=Mucilaginibacter myungsuensis TaxID=649104 RepID=A0A929PX51_9SPHI|nr:YCF48-related protein [Mucilaginibacter myungsuensis]MBE9662030.1 oxidoreductase [Mucilaginibacter myungsuensis]MDN3599537.1 YCF48-related protein [Mucilaginibacter myungsuensis]